MPDINKKTGCFPLLETTELVVPFQTKDEYK